LTDVVAPASRRAQVMAPSMDLLAATVGDMTTECFALVIGLEPNSSPLRNAIFAPYPNLPLTCEGLKAAVEGRPDIQWTTKTRYWHGYRTILDPLTALLRINDARYVMLTLLVAAIIWFGRELKLLAGEKAALAFLIPTVLLTDLWRVFQAMVHSLSTTFIFAGAAFMARKVRNGGNLIVTAAVLGSVLNFIDSLINPPWQPMLLAFVVLVGGKSLVDALKVVVAWGVGYAMTWVSKWLIALAAGAPWSQISKAISFRLNGDYADQISHRLLVPSAKVLPFLFREIMWQAPAVVIIAILIPMTLPRQRPQWRTLAMLSLPAIIPLIWFEILSNHTQIHPWFAFRPLASSIGIVCSAWVIASQSPLAGVSTVTLATAKAPRERQAQPERTDFQGI